MCMFICALVNLLAGSAFLPWCKKEESYNDIFGVFCKILNLACVVDKKMFAWILPMFLLM